MIGACVGVFVALVAMALFVVTILRKPDGTTDSVELGAAAVAALPSLLLVLWGAWTLLQLVMGVGMLTVAPVYYVLWGIAGLTHLALAVMMLANIALFFSARGASGERAEQLHRSRRALSFALPVLALLEILASVGVVFVTTVS